MGKAKLRATSDEPRFLDGYLPYLMARASYLISAQFQRYLAAQGIRTSVWRMLATLAGTSGRTIGELADEMILQQPTVTKIVDRLEKEGLIERGSSANDRRQVVVRLTPRGVALISSLQKEAAQHQNECWQLIQRPRPSCCFGSCGLWWTATALRNGASHGALPNSEAYERRRSPDAERSHRSQMD